MEKIANRLIPWHNLSVSVMFDSKKDHVCVRVCVCLFDIDIGQIGSIARGF